VPTVTVLPLGRMICVYEGTSLLAALLGAGISIPQKCEGRAKCGSCHIFVQKGRNGLSKVERVENERLNAILGAGSKSRLACQARVRGTDSSITILLLGSSLQV
jgi:ferredoxin, 2Fe-2S